MHSMEWYLANGDAVDTALGIIDEIIQKEVRISINATYQSAHDLYIFEQLPLRLMKDEMKNRNPQSEVIRGFEIKICQAS